MKKPLTFLEADILHVSWLDRIGIDEHVSIQNDIAEYKPPGCSR